MRKKNMPQGLETLRKRAEGYLIQNNTIHDDHFAFADEIRLYHELQVHQIELEMQNEELLQAQSDLVETQKKITELVDFAPNCYFTLSIEGRILEVNYTGASLLGEDRDKLVNLHFENFISPSDKTIFIQSQLNLIKTRLHQVCELRIVRSDGHRLFVRLDLSIISNKDKLQFLLIVTDISLQKHIEDTQSFLLGNSWTGSGRDFFEVLAEYLSQTLQVDYVCIDKLVSGKLEAQTVAIYFDGHFEDNVKYSLHDTPCGKVVGQSVCCFSKDVRQLFPKDTILQDMQAESYVGITLWGSDGKPIGLIAVISRRPLMDSQSIEIVLKQVSIRAVSELEHRQIEEVLREREFFFRESQRAGLIGSFKLNFNAKEWESSEVLDQIFGINNDYTKSMDGWTNLLHPEDRKMLHQYIFTEAVSNHLTLDKEYRIIRKSDSILRWVHLKGNINFSKGNIPASIVGTINDITERKQKEDTLYKLNQALAALSKSRQAIMQAVEEPDYLDKVCRIVAEYCGYPLVWIGFAENDVDKSIRPVASAGFDEGYLESLHLTWDDSERGQGPTGRAIRNGTISACRNMHTDPSFKPWREMAMKHGYASSIVFPLTEDQKSFGAFCVYSKEPDSFQADEITLLSDLANDLAQGITSLRLRAARLKAEELLTESEQRYRSLFEESNDAIFLVDLSTGRYTDCNRLAETLTGYAREEIIGMKTGTFLPPPLKGEEQTNIEVILSGKVLRTEAVITTRDKRLIPVEFHSSMITINKKQCILSLMHDISDRKASEDALKQSEERVRIKLQSILSPEGSISDLELNDIIDVPSIQKLMDNFYELVQIPMAIIDINGKTLVGVGWQEICTRFHRMHPKTCRNCIESDIYLTHGIPDGEFKLYKCKNNMWDIATPLIIGGEHKGNLYMGQFFFDSEPIDYKIFSDQADKYGFAKREYLEALEKVPRISKQKLDYAKEFFLSLSRSISQLSYSNIKLARAIAQQKQIEDALRESEEFLKKAQKIGNLGSWSLDLTTNRLTWSDEMYTIFGQQPHEFSGRYEDFLETVYPEDRDAVNSAYTNSASEGKDNYEIEHRVIRRHTGELRHVFEKCEHIRDASGKVIRSVGMTHDITERKLSEEALSANERLLRESQAVANIGSYSANLINGKWKASPELYKIFGVDNSFPHTLEAWENVIHPDYRDQVMAYLQQRAVEEKRFDHEYKIIRVNDGNHRWVHGLGEFVFDTQMNPVGIIGTIQDITVRKQAEEDLRESETRFRLALKNAPVSVAAQDRDLKYLWAFNQRTVKPTDIIGTTDSDIFTPEDAAMLTELKRQVINTGEELYRQLWIRSNGEKAFLDLYLEPLRNKTGDIVGVGTATVDLTRVKLTEEALHENEATLLGILNGTTESILLFSTEGKVLLGNKTAWDRLGMPPEKVIGKMSNEFLPEELAKSRQNHLQEVTRTGSPIIFEDKRADTFFEHNLYPVTSSEGKINRVVIFSKDITERKNAEELLTKSHEVLEKQVKERTHELINTNYVLLQEISDREKAEKVLLASQTQLRALTQRMDQIAEEERTNIAREIHDEMGHMLTVMKYDMESLANSRVISAEFIKNEIESLMSMIDALIDTVRKISTELRPGILDHLGLFPAIEWQIRQFQKRTKICCHFNKKDADMEFNNNETTIIFRIVQETLTNVARHSDATILRLSAVRKNNQFILKASDNGKGFDMNKAFKSGSLGLIGMRERALSIGGEISIKSKPGKGTSISLILNK